MAKPLTLHAGILGLLGNSESRVIIDRVMIMRSSCALNSSLVAFRHYHVVHNLIVLKMENRVDINDVSTI
jgi:hypothetical protein